MRGMSSSLVLCLVWQASASANQPLDLAPMLAKGYGPIGIAAASDGSVYLGASKPGVSTDAIFKFGPGGEQQLIFPQPEAPPKAQLTSIAQMDVDTLGRIYAYDGSQREFKIYDSGGAFLSNLPLPPDAPLGFDMAVGPPGELHLLKDNLVRVYDTTGTLLRTFGQSGPPEGQLVNSRSMTVDDEGYVYVAHMDNERIFVGGPGLLANENVRSIKVFDPLGEFVRSFPIGSTSPNRDLATTVTTAGNRVLVTDGASGIMQRFSRNGILEATAYGIPAVRHMDAANDGSVYFILRPNDGFVQGLTSAEFKSRRVGVSSYFDYVRSEYQQRVLDEAGIGRNNTAAETFAQTFLVPGELGQNVELEFHRFAGGGGYSHRFGVFDRSRVVADPLEDPAAFMLEAMDARILIFEESDRKPKKVTVSSGTELGFFLFPDTYDSLEEDVAWVQHFVYEYDTKVAFHRAQLRTDYPFFSIAEANHGRVDQFATFLGDDRTVIAVEDLLIREESSINFTDYYVSINRRLIPVPEPRALAFSISALLAPFRFRARNSPSKRLTERKPAA